MPGPHELLLLTVTFLLAGLVKGVIGMGLPTVALALLTATFNLQFAMTMLLAPSLVTNIWQALSGGSNFRLVKRLWPLLLAASIAVWLGSIALTVVSLDWLSGLLGVLLALYALLSLAGAKFRVTRAQEPWMAPLTGVINGVFAGMTGSFVVPGVMYLQALGLPRDQLIKAMGMLFTVSTVALGFALHGHQILSLTTSLLSAFGVLPALLGMWIGQRIRQQLSEAVFRRTFFVSVLLVACYILFNAFRTA